jgi:hypothetical protein
MAHVVLPSAMASGAGQGPFFVVSHTCLTGSKVMRGGHATDCGNDRKSHVPPKIAGACESQGVPTLCSSLEPSLNNQVGYSFMGLDVIDAP